MGCCWASIRHWGANVFTRPADPPIITPVDEPATQLGRNWQPLLPLSPSPAAPPAPPTPVAPEPFKPIAYRPPVRNREREQARNEPAVPFREVSDLFGDQIGGDEGREDLVYVQWDAPGMDESTQPTSDAASQEDGSGWETDTDSGLEGAPEPGEDGCWLANMTLEEDKPKRKRRKQEPIRPPHYEPLTVATEFDPPTPELKVGLESLMGDQSGVLAEAREACSSAIGVPQGCVVHLESLPMASNSCRNNLQRLLRRLQEAGEVVQQVRLEDCCMHKSDLEGMLQGELGRIPFVDATGVVLV